MMNPLSNRDLSDPELVHSLFKEIFLSLCSNPTVVTAVAKNSVLSSGKPELELAIQPWLIELAMKLTVAYLGLDKKVMNEEIVNLTQEMIVKVESMRN